MYLTCNQERMVQFRLGALLSINSIMSLISQKDRDLTIEAIDFYLFSKGIDMTEQKRAELNALLNWIKLENYKNS